MQYIEDIMKVSVLIIGLLLAQHYTPFLFNSFWIAQSNAFPVYDI